MEMKKYFLLLFSTIALFGINAIKAQTNVHQGSPASFMYLQGQPWVEPRYGTTSGGTTTTNSGVNQLTTTTDGSGNHSHAFVVRTANGQSGTDCAACYGFGNNYNYHMNVMAPAWDGSPGAFVDTVIQIGDRYTTIGGNRCQELIYTFKPDTINPVLLLNYMTVLQNVVNSSHHFQGNPRIEISVTNANGQLLPLGYYPNDYYTGYQQTSSTSSGPFTYNVNRPINGNFGPHGPWTIDYNDNPGYQANTAWPYAKYVFAAPGTGGSAYAEMTPSWVDFQYYTCPQGQASSGCQSGSYEVVSYPYTIVAFNLTEQARLGQTVKLKIYKRGCTPAAHWAEMYFTAKMVPGKVEADVCNNDDIITLDVPWGFKTYQWCYGLNENSPRYLLDNQTQQLQIMRNDLNTTVWPYYCCVMESWTGVPFVYKAKLQIYDMVPHFNIKQVNNEDCSLTFQFTDSSMANMYVPSVGADNQPTGQYDTTHLANWHRTWLYKDANGVVHEFGGANAHSRNFTITIPADQVDQYRQIGLSISDEHDKCFSVDSAWRNFEYDETYLDSVVVTDTIITCEEKIVYDAATFGDQYTWTTPGTRLVRYQGAAWNGCDSLVKVTYIIQKPHINQLLYTDEYCDEFSTTLYADANMVPAHYRWKYQYHSDTTFEETVDPTADRITITKPGTYTLTISDTSGCEATAEITIDPCKPFINLPNAITPSKPDGLNDCIEVIQRDLLESLEFTVYTRSGELVYRTTDKNFCWDGRIDGKLYTNVTYVYVLKTVDYNGQSSMFKGSLLVL